MRINIVVCDHCGRAIHGQVETYRVEPDGKAIDICSSCQQKPFKALREPCQQALDLKRIISGLTSEHH